MTWPGLEPEPLDVGVWSTDCKTGASPFYEFKTNNWWSLFFPTSPPTFGFFFFWLAFPFSLSHHRSFFFGVVDSPQNPCALRTCPPHAKCVIVANGTADCACPRSCPTSLNFVCGSNGKSYRNTCELERDSCKRNKVIRVSHRGYCESK